MDRMATIAGILVAGFVGMAYVHGDMPKWRKIMIG